MKKNFLVCAMAALAFAPFAVSGQSGTKTKQAATVKKHTPPPASKTKQAAPAKKVADTIPVWKILWLIYPNLQFTYPEDATNGKAGQTTVFTMTPEEVEVARHAAVEFKKFVEKAANGKVIMDMTVDVSPNVPVTMSGNWKNKYAFWLENIPAADKQRLRFNKTVARNGRTDLPQDYDCVIATTPRDDLPYNYAGVTSGHSRYTHARYGVIRASDFGRPLYVHEWIHQLERNFEGCKEMPCLHCDGAHGYTEANLGITPPCHECKNERWYGDILGGCIVDMPDASHHHKGIAGEWWKYPPLLQDKIAESEGLNSTSNGQQTLVKRFCD